MAVGLQPFSSRIRFALRPPAFDDAEWWTWCGAVLHGKEGRYHLFASRWPRRMPFFNGYLAASRVVYACAEQPEGPFVYQHDVLRPTGEDRWDGQMTHNPAIIEFAGRYWLFYIGLSYRQPHPDLQAPFDSWRETYRRIRIGLAVADRPDGLFERLDKPVIDTDVAPWPHLVCTNPSVLVTPQGKIRVYYRTPRLEGGRVHNVLAVAEADHPQGPYRPLRDTPLLPPTCHLEDPHVWWNGQAYEALAKDLNGNTAGQVHASVHLHSPDGLQWQVAPQPTAYRRELRFQDGSSQEVGNLERPWLLRDSSGKATMLYAAASDDPRGFHHARRTWLQAMVLD